MVVYRRGRARQAVLSGVWGLLVMGFVWFTLYLFDPHGIAASAIPLFNVGLVLALAVASYRRTPWLVRTSYHGIDLNVDGPVRLPWMAITSIYVTGQKITVTVGDPTTPESLARPERNGSVWSRTTFQTVTPEIAELLVDLANRLPYLEIKHY